MADDKRKKIIEDFGKDVDTLQSKLNNVISTLGNQLDSTLRNKMQGLTDSAQNFIGAFEKGEDITKKLNEKLKTLASDINKQTAERLSLETQLAKVANKRDKTQRDAILDKILVNKLTTKQLEDTQTTLIKLLQIAEAEKQIAEEKKKQSSVSGFLKNKLREINAEYFSTLGILKLIINGALRYNKVSVDISKNFGYGAEQANRVASSLKDMAQTSNNVNVTLKSLGDAMNDISTATGFVTEYSKDTLETQVMLTKQLGLTGEEAAGFYKYSVLTGKSSKDTYTNIKNSFVAMRNQLGVGIPFKSTMAEIAKISAEIAARLGYNPSAIAKAVVQVKALGSSLEQTKGQADSLLDFESSIENELKAELLTGQSLNLERARALSLSGNLAGVAEELANQGMTAAKYGQMNVISQKSYAAALGLTTEQLSEQLQKRELAIASGKSLAQLTEEEADQAAKRQDIQTKFNAAIEKLQDLIGNLVAGPLGKMLDIITSILNNTILLSAAMAVYIGRQTYSLTMSAAAFLLARKTAKMTAVDAAAESAKSAAKVPFIGGFLAIAAGLATFAAISGLFSKGDDVASTGYGKRMLFDKGSITALNDNDNLYATTNTLKPNKNDNLYATTNTLKPNGGGGGGNAGGSNIDVIAALDRIANRPSVAYIQGERPFADNLGRQQQLFTSGMQNQSRLA
jgi:hypothetical protein